MTDPRNPWKPDPNDDRIPIGPGDNVSVMRWPGMFGHLVIPSEYQVPEEPQYKFVGGGVNPFIGDVYGSIKQFFIVHASIIRRAWASV
ncbi:MAG TPA: hypothetical protein VIP51_05515 [Eoetvoesiella sp.]